MKTLDAALAHQARLFEAAERDGEVSPEGIVADGAGAQRRPTA